MIRRYATALHAALITADWASAAVLFVAVSIFRFGSAEWVVTWVRAGTEWYVAAGAYASVWVGALWLHGLYRLRAHWSLRTEALQIGRAALLVAVVAFGALFAFKLPDVSRTFLLTLFAAQIVVTIASRFAIRWILQAMRDRGHNTRYVLVVGTNRTATRFADKLERHRQLGLRVVGHLVAGRATEELEVGGRAVAAIPAQVGGRPVLGTTDSIEQILDDFVVDEVAICLPANDLALVEPISRLCEETGRIVRIPLDEYALSLPGGHVEEFGGGQVLSLVYGPDRAISLATKRLIDIAGAVVALVLLAPVFGLIALAIRLRDGSPVLFRQTRVGLHGRPFDVVKFRTMVPDAEDRLADLEGLNEISGHAFKVTVDPRISRTGGFLRRSSLDELPQLWNVVRGEMSIVGPRPPLPREVAGYDLWHRRRLSMKPGITGLWQVSARGEEDFDRWVELDLAYIDRWSLWLDIKIMVRTVPAMLQGR